MFDEGAKITLFFVLVAASIVSLAAQQNAPLPSLATAVDISALPPLPETASADGAPAQTRVAEMQIALGDGFQARLLHGYVLEGRVVTRREFRNDPTSAISPLDLGVVWGALAEPGGVDQIEFRTAPRAVWSRPSDDAQLPIDWEHQVTNNHLVPASQELNEALLAVEIGERVRISGYLVEVTGADISPWRSSTLRGDNTIIGGCEIILVTAVEILPGHEKSA